MNNGGATSLASGSQIKFIVQEVTNPISTMTSGSFSIYTTTSDQTYNIDQKTSGLTITNTDPATITTAVVGV